MLAIVLANLTTTRIIMFMKDNNTKDNNNKNYKNKISQIQNQKNNH